MNLPIGVSSKNTDHTFYTIFDEEDVIWHTREEC